MEEDKKIPSSYNSKREKKKLYIIIFVALFFLVVIGVSYFSMFNIDSSSGYTEEYMERAKMRGMTGVIIIPIIIIATAGLYYIRG